MNSRDKRIKAMAEKRLDDLLTEAWDYSFHAATETDGVVLAIGKAVELIERAFRAGEAATAARGAP